MPNFQTQYHQNLEDVIANPDFDGYNSNFNKLEKSAEQIERSEGPDSTQILMTTNNTKKNGLNQSTKKFNPSENLGEMNFQNLVNLNNPQLLNYGQ